MQLPQFLVMTMVVVVTRTADWMQSSGTCIDIRYTVRMLDLVHLLSNDPNKYDVPILSFRCKDTERSLDH
jgi:hypothetical protein